MRLFENDAGQLLTMEGIVAALILVFAIIYIMNSITLVSPQTSNSVVMKLDIQAEDTMNVLATVDQPANYSSVLVRNISAWTGYVADNNNEVDPRESSIISLNNTIKSLLPSNVLFNLNIIYLDDAGHIVTKQLIYHGDPQDNAVSASKKIVINDEDVRNYPASWWVTNNFLVADSSASWWTTAHPTASVHNPPAEPKTVEVQLVAWTI